MGNILLCTLSDLTVFCRLIERSDWKVWKVVKHISILSYLVSASRRLLTVASMCVLLFLCMFCVVPLPLYAAVFAPISYFHFEQRQMQVTMPCATQWTFARMHTRRKTERAPLSLSKHPEEGNRYTYSSVLPSLCLELEVLEVSQSAFIPYQQRNHLHYHHRTGHAGIWALRSKTVFTLHLKNKLLITNFKSLFIDSFFVPFVSLKRWPL